MKKQALNALMILLAALPAGYLGYIWPSLPETVPLHFGIDMKPDRMGDKSEMWVPVLLLAAVSIGVFFLLQNLNRFDPKRKDAAQAATFQKLGAGFVVFMTALNFLIIRAAVGDHHLQTLVFPLLGLLFAFLGNYMVHLKPNYFAGFRLPWTLSNDENWRKTHALGGKVWFAGGLLIAVVSFFIPSELAVFFFLAAIFIMVVVPVIYSYRLFKKQS